MSSINNTILMPFREDNDFNNRIFFETCRDYYLSEGYTVETFDSGEEFFNRSASRNLAVDSSEDSICILIDADTIIPSYAIQESIMIAKKYNAMVKPTIRTYSMSSLDKLKLIIEKIKNCEVMEDINYRHRSIDLYPGSGWVIPRNLFYEIGKFNEDFIGYGYEDIDFNYRASINSRIFFTEYNAFTVSHPIQRIYGDENNEDLFSITKSLWSNKIPEVSIYSQKNMAGSPEHHIKKVFGIE